MNIRSYIGLFAGFAACIILTGCYPTLRRADLRHAILLPGKPNSPEYQATAKELDKKWHTILVPANTNVVIKTWDWWNPLWYLKNADDPVPPSDYHPDWCEFMRKLEWGLRNPLHNAFFYGIGDAHKNKTRSGYYPEYVGNPNGGWNFAITGSNFMRYLFLSYSSEHWDIYFGWRNRGNFGAKVNIHFKGKSKKHKKNNPPTSRPPDQPRAVFYLIFHRSLSIFIYRKVCHTRWFRQTIPSKTRFDNGHRFFLGNFMPRGNYQWFGASF